MGLPKSVVIAVSSYNGEFYDDGRPTGAFFSEVFEPFQVFHNAGFSVTIVFETGKFGWDAKSIESPFITEEQAKELHNPSTPFTKTVKAAKSATDVKASDFGIFYAAGGHGTVFDFDGKAPNLSKLAGAIFDAGGILSAVCHGPVLLGHVKDKNGNLIAAGKKVTGFPSKGETELGLQGALDKHHVRTVEDILGKESHYVEPNPWSAELVVQDGRVLTGANPASAGKLAEQDIEAFNSL